MIQVLRPPKPVAYRHPAFLAAIAPFLLGACEAAPAGGDGTVVRDSADLVIVENDARRPGWGTDGRRLSAEPVFQVGAVDVTGPEQLHRVIHSAFLPGGDIAVIDLQTAEVRVFDADGRHVRTLGGQGDGPGEFRSPWRVYPLPGDSLAVVDLYRAVSVFDRDGRYVRRFVPGGIEGESQGVPRGQFGDGSLLFMQYQRSDPARTGVGRTQVELVRIDLEGTQVQSYGLFDEQTIRFGGGPQQVFGPRATMGTSDTGFLYAPGDRFEVQHVGTEGRTARLVRLDLEPRPVLAAHVDTWWEMMIANNPNMPEERLRQLLGEVDSPPHFPYHGEMVVDDQGGYWVQEFPIPGDEAPGHWHVFDPEGRYLGRVEAPAGFTLHEVRGDQVLGRWRDEFEVEYVRVHLLEEGRP